MSVEDDPHVRRPDEGPGLQETSEQAPPAEATALAEAQHRQALVEDMVDELLLLFPEIDQRDARLVELRERLLNPHPELRWSSASPDPASGAFH